MKIVIEKNQHPTAILNKLFSIKETDVQLIFPGDSDFFADPENLKLLKNQSDLLQKHVSIICPNSLYVELAKNHGISATTQEYKGPEIEEPFFEEVEDDNTPAVEAFTKRYFDLAPKENEEQPEPPPTEEKKQEAPIKKKETESFFQPSLATPQKPLAQELSQASKKSGRARVYKFILTLIGLGILGFLYIYLPRATVEVFAKRERISFTIEVTGKKSVSSVDSEARLIPAERLMIEKELSQNVTLSAKGSFSEKARGEVRVFNENATPQPMIPSRFEAENGNIYWSQRNIRIPAKGSLQIEIVAEKPGDEYNLDCSQKDPCKFTIPAWKGTNNFTTVFAVGEDSISGGIEGEGFIVSQEEYSKAETALRSQLLEEAQKELIATIPTGFTILEDTIRSEVTNVESDPSVEGFSTDGKAVIRGTARLEAFVIREEDIKTLIDTIVTAQLDEGKETRPETVQMEYSPTQVNLETSELTLSVTASEDVAAILDEADIKKKLAGRSEAQVREALSETPNVHSAQVTLWPFWVRAIPENLERIEITIK